MPQLTLWAGDDVVDTPHYLVLAELLMALFANVLRRELIEAIGSPCYLLAKVSKALGGETIDLILSLAHCFLGEVLELRIVKLQIPISFLDNVLCFCLSLGRVTIEHLWSQNIDNVCACKLILFLILLLPNFYYRLHLLLLAWRLMQFDWLALPWLWSSNLKRVISTSR